MLNLIKKYFKSNQRFILKKMNSTINDEIGTLNSEDESSTSNKKVVDSLSKGVKKYPSNAFEGLGKRKTSVAKVFLTQGSGIILINKERKSFEEFFSGVLNERETIQNPFLVVHLVNEYDITIYVKGGGISSQIEAIRLAISKAICKIQQEYRPILKQNLYLRRDSRIKERRKYGLKKARKASQYSKR